ncbi:MAG: lipid-A-disaccharide synthase [Verrucomicrobiota bacterium]
MAKTIYFVAGEASGDEHGAALMRSLRALHVDLDFQGRGGPKMKAIAGGSFADWIDQAAIVGLWEVIKHLGYFRKQFRETLSQIEESKPDAVVLIDYPGFNLRLARALRRRTRDLKIIYYISPQVWAWNRRRIPRMAEWLDLMLCIFPFEAELYNKSGLRTLFVGHPMIENLRSQKIDMVRDPNLVGLFPGSRLREVRKILPIMLEAARELLKTHPNIVFAIAAASESLSAEIAGILSCSPLPRGKLHVVIGGTWSVMREAFAGIVASGTATLEAAFFRMPFVLVYKVSWATYFAARLVVKVKYLGMPNVLAEKEIVPEFIQGRANPAAIAETMRRLLNDEAARQGMISQFDAIVAKLGESGASERAAEAIVQELGSTS